MRYAVTSIFFALCFALASSLPGRAEEMTRTQADAIISELRQIRSLLEKLQPGEVVTPTRTPAAPARPPRGAAAGEKIRVAVGNIEALGRSDAPVTIVEFTDYQCPFCRQFHVSTFEQLKTQYIDTGKVRYVSRDLPLAIHPQAVTAAHAARCAGDQKKFWEMRHVVVVNANHLAPEKYVTFARDLHLDADRFQSCMATDKYKSDIQRDLSDAQAAGISGTPTFVVGRTQSDGAIEGHKIVGAQPYATFEARLKELLTTMGPGAGSE